MLNLGGVDGRQRGRMLGGDEVVRRCLEAVWRTSGADDRRLGRETGAVAVDGQGDSDILALGCFPRDVGDGQSGLRAVGRKEAQAGRGEGLQQLCDLQDDGAELSAVSSDVGGDSGEDTAGCGFPVFHDFVSFVLVGSLSRRV